MVIPTLEYREGSGEGFNGVGAEEKLNGSEMWKTICSICRRNIYGARRRRK